MDDFDEKETKVRMFSKRPSVRVIVLKFEKQSRKNGTALYCGWLCLSYLCHFGRAPSRKSPHVSSWVSSIRLLDTEGTAP
jgi:hypothetical protein